MWVKDECLLCRKRIIKAMKGQDIVITLALTFLFDNPLDIDCLMTSLDKFAGLSLGNRSLPYMATTMT